MERDRPIVKAMRKETKGKNEFRNNGWETEKEKKKVWMKKKEFMKDAQMKNTHILLFLLCHIFFIMLANSALSLLVINESLNRWC